MRAGCRTRLCEDPDRWPRAAGRAGPGRTVTARPGARRWIRRGWAALVGRVRPRRGLLRGRRQDPAERGAAVAPTQLTGYHDGRTVVEDTRAAVTGLAPPAGDDPAPPTTRADDH
jgi:hypothetical protein